MAGRAIGACRSVAKRFLSVIPLGPISRRNYGYVVSHVHRQPDSFVFFFIANFSIYQPYTNYRYFSIVYCLFALRICDCEFGSSMDLRVYSACNWNYEGKEEARKKGRINHKARLFRAMLMTPPASLARHQVSLFSPFFFFFHFKGATHLLDAIAGNKTLLPGRSTRGTTRERPAMEATTVLGRVTSAAPRERTMYRPPPSRFSSTSSPKYTAAVN